jgi:hypothetical protein
MATCILLDATDQANAESADQASRAHQLDAAQSEAASEVDVVDSGDWERWPLLERVGLDGLLILTGGI